MHIARRCKEISKGICSFQVSSQRDLIARVPLFPNSLGFSSTQACQVASQGSDDRFDWRVSSPPRKSTEPRSKSNHPATESSQRNPNTQRVSPGSFVGKPSRPDPYEVRPSRGRGIPVAKTTQAGWQWQADAREEATRLLNCRARDIAAKMRLHRQVNDLEAVLRLYSPEILLVVKDLLG